MAMKAEHDRASREFFPKVRWIAILTGLAIAWSYDAITGAIAAIILPLAYNAGAYYLLPDLDLWSVCVSRWKGLAFIWWAYSKDFGHRGSSVSEFSLSHWPILGTLTRLLYLALWGMLPGLVYALQQPDTLTTLIGWGVFYQENVEPYAVAIFVGVEIAAWVHIYKDIEYSEKQKRKWTIKSKQRRSSRTRR